jgi:hypothetical protein
MKIRDLTLYGKVYGRYIVCPACKKRHIVDTTWRFNGNYENPTLYPSIVYGRQEDGDLCHSFVTKGQIGFCQDSQHKLAGKTVILPYIGEHDDAIRTGSEDS